MAVSVAERPQITMVPYGDGTVGVIDSGLYRQPAVFEYPESGLNYEDPSTHFESAAADESRSYSGRAVHLPGLIERGLESIPTAVGRNVRRIALPASVLSLAAPVAAAAAEKPVATASSQSPAQGVRIVEQTTTTTIRAGGTRRTTEDFAKFTVLGNYRTATKADMKKAEKAGRCENFDGTEETIYTQGYNASGKQYGRDTRKSRFCFWNGRWYRKICGNRAIIGRAPKNAIKTPVIWVNNWNKSKLTVRVHSEEKVESSCDLPGVSASAIGGGEATVEARIRAKTAVTAKGKLKRLITRHTNEVKGLAHTRAVGDAQTRCESTTTTTTTTETQPAPPPKPTPTVTPTPTPVLPKPPEGEMKPPAHLRPQGIGQICVDNIVGKNGRPVEAVDSSFRVFRTDDEAPTIEQKQGVGQFTGSVYTQAGGARCKPYQAPPNPWPNPEFSVSATAQLHDGLASSGWLQPKQFIITQDIFGRTHVELVGDETGDELKY